mmetsp:Transcript_5296/g.15679  ORF Transcript_5296/g.15679 Transcript_5296/m.15679 type:complete len:263 (-) Transcript_5296:376-1164(-)
MPMPFLRQGEKPPEVTMPTSAPDSSRSAVPSRTGAPWSTTKPHRARVRDLSRSSARMRSEPQKEPSSARRRLAITHASAPSTGDVVSSRSLPYKQRPASRRRESRAPSPTGVTSSLSSSVLQSPRTACCDPPPGGTAISNPSSPVYPERATKHCSPATSIGRALMKGIWERSTGVSACSTSAAAGPCSARMPLLGSVSTDASLPEATNFESCASMCGRSLSSCPALMTMYRWSPALVMIMSSMMPPASLVRRERVPLPSGSA